MTSKIKIRDSKRTKQKLISAVGKILKKEGFASLGVNKVAEVAGVSKKLLYDYFGGLDGLVTAYLQQVDFWKLEERKMDNAEEPIPEITKDFLFNLLKNDFEYFSSSVEMQKIVLWGIYKKNKHIRALTDEREAMGERVFAKADDMFKDTEVDLRATLAILVAAIYYTVLHAKTNGSTMCGIDMASKEGKERMLNAMDQILDLTCRF